MKQTHISTRIFYAVLVWIFLLATMPVNQGMAQPMKDGPNPDTPGGTVVSPVKKLESIDTQAIGEPIRPEGITGSDLYGYTWSVSGAVEPFTTTGTEIYFLDNDDGFSDQIPIGFDFPFYENLEASIFINVNGILTFDAETVDYNNRSIPFLGAPNNFIAPFWDDLIVPLDKFGKVFYQASSDKFVVVWQNVARISGSSVDPHLLTFEVILYKYGKICFQYQNMSGTLNEATIGIEDSDGVDGLAYLYNADGLLNLVGDHSLCFLPPGLQYRVKALPTYQGGFAVNRVAEFKVDINNIGTRGDDRYDLAVSATNWATSFIKENGSPLINTGGDPSPDTGLISPGSGATIVVRLTAPPGSSIGANTKVILTVTSASDPSQKRLVVLQAAIPAAFSQAFRSGGNSIDLAYIWAANQRNVTLSPTFTGSSLAITALQNAGYMYLWERNVKKVFGSSKVSYTNLEYSLLTQAGFIQHPIDKIYDNSIDTTENTSVSDTSPALAVSPSGNVGIIWKREQMRFPSSVDVFIKSNIYFMIFNPNNPSHAVFGPVNVTNNTSEGTSDNIGVPFHYRPKIVATKDGNFTLLWEENQTVAGGKQVSLYRAIYSPGDVDPLNDPSVVQQFSSGTSDYRGFGATNLSGSRVLVAYSFTNLSGSIPQLSYSIFDSEGNTISEIPLIFNVDNVDAEGLTAIQLPSGYIILAFTERSNGVDIFYDRIKYIVLKGTDYSFFKTDIPGSPDQFEENYVSLQVGENGNGVITWIDSDLKHELYYALISPDGSLLTPAMAFQATDPGKEMLVNDSGYSLASYSGSYVTCLPLTVKK